MRLPSKVTLAAVVAATARLPCLQADMDHYVSLRMARLRHP